MIKLIFALAIYILGAVIENLIDHKFTRSRSHRAKNASRKFKLPKITIGKLCGIVFTVAVRFALFEMGF